MKILRDVGVKRVALLFVILLSMFAFGLLWTQGFSDVAWATGKTATNTYYLPMIFQSYGTPLAQICRFGLDATGDITSYLVNSLRVGWFQDWSATNSARPGGMTFVPMVHVSQVGSNSYSYTPSGDALTAVIAANPGAIWQIGNEPDRPHWQDDLDPTLYARAYHDAYAFIKSKDPTAQIAAGSIVQPTPLRLQYLDIVLNTYSSVYGQAMPVDIWNIHSFILQEKSCDYYPTDCWGADVPRGVNATQGMLYSIQDNDNLTIFEQNIQAFRQWMAARGYQNRPLIITEFGVQMPGNNYFNPDFSPQRVNNYMNNTFNWLSTATDTTGYPYDGNRLVQRWAWYSLTDTNYNGWLFDPTTKTRTSFGDNFAAYTGRITPAPNVAPVTLWADPGVPISGSLVNAPLHAQVVNNGNLKLSNAVPVRFYNGNPAAGGIQIGTDQFVSALDGCGTLTTASVIWNNVTPGQYLIYVTAGQNSYSSNVVISASGTQLPATRK